MAKYSLEIINYHKTEVMKKIITNLLVSSVLIFVSLASISLVSTPLVFAQEPATTRCPDGSRVREGSPCLPAATGNCSKNSSGALECKASDTNDKCGTVKTSINFGCTGTGNGIYDLLFAVIRFLTVGVGLVLIVMTVISGIQYTMSQGDPSATKAIKLRLFGVGVALVMYLLGMALLNFLIPGGLLG